MKARFATEGTLEYHESVSGRAKVQIREQITKAKAYMDANPQTEKSGDKSVNTDTLSKKTLK